MATLIGARRKELNDLETIRFVTSALFDVSADKIDSLRTSFGKNVLFYKEIGDLYKYVKRAASLRNQLPNGNKSIPRRVSIAFTTNSRFYGSVNTDVMNSFIKSIHGAKGDYMVIGRMGEFFMRNFPNKNVSFLSFEKDDPTTEEMRLFLEKVAVYDQIYIFYSTFVNIFTQKVSILDIAHTPTPDESGHIKESVDYIFEPELPQILAFFESRVRYLLLQRIMLESELARTSARLIAMNRAQDRADSALKSLRHLLKRDAETFNDARLLETFSAISKWKK